MAATAMPIKPSVMTIYPGIVDADMNISLALWAKTLPFCKTLLVAGQHATAENQRLLSHEHVSGYFPGVEVVSQVAAEMTPHQSDWITEQLRARLPDYGILDVSFAVWPAHMPRAFLTQLRSLLVADIADRVRLKPVLIPWSPVGKIRLTGPWRNEEVQTRIASGESSRVEAYTTDPEKVVKDLALDYEVYDYFNRMWPRA